MKIINSKGIKTKTDGELIQVWKPKPAIGFAQATPRPKED